MKSEVISSIDLEKGEPSVDYPEVSAVRSQIAESLEPITSVEAKTAFLVKVMGMIAENGGQDLGENSIFSYDLQRLDRFNLGFMDPALFKELCAEFGLDAEKSEAIMMQTDQVTQPHVHLEGFSVFLPLGPEHGYKKSAGGTYMGDYVVGEERFLMDYVEATPGKVFGIPPGVIHFFCPRNGSCLTAIAFVDPKIKTVDGDFDILNFASPEISVDGNEVSVSLL